MGTTALRPDRRLESIPGYDYDRERSALRYRTEWWVQGHLIDFTPWRFSPRQAIRDGDEVERADREYAQLLHSHDAA